LTSFHYKARDRYDILTAGTLEAADTRAVALQLEKMGFTPVDISPVESGGAFLQLENWVDKFSKITEQEVVVFTRQMASILQAGVSLVEGLDAIQEQIRNRKFKRIIINVKKNIEGGTTFSDALERYKSVFSPLVVNMVRAGEKAGILAEVLDRISNVLDKDLETNDKIKSATRYPMLVLGTLSFAFIVLTVFVIPRFVYFFSAFKTELPLPTRILIGINYVLINYWLWMVFVITVGGYLLKKFIDSEKGGYTWDLFILSLPVLGPLFSRIFLSRFCRMLGTMIGSGIPILEALVIAAATVDNRVIAKVILDVRDEVSRGRSLSEPMKGSQIFPPIAVAMVAIGEKAGTLKTMLESVSNYFDREVDYTVKNLVPLLEPAMIFGLGLIVLLFALGIFLPMWDLVKVYKSF